MEKGIVMKKIYLLFVCLLAFTGAAYATEELRLYYNSENGWRRYADASYYGPNKNIGGRYLGNAGMIQHSSLMVAIAHSNRQPRYLASWSCRFV